MDPNNNLTDHSIKNMFSNVLMCGITKNISSRGSERSYVNALNLIVVAVVCFALGDIW